MIFQNPEVTEAFYKGTGKTIREGYGQTETVSMFKRVYFVSRILSFCGRFPVNSVVGLMGDPKSDRWRYLVFQFYYPYICAVSFSQTALKMIRHRQ